eukprot:TRINITY_DN36337_c0_g1_i1.p1 TRINITY_DN36337_c0_g1~~TRINITY_DN36337_c0_g1_i1.p1  ORF type:complete len:587 (+),score=165.14 TRINITY_DN36337_c0_g1_i1:55-1761(+)
MPGDFSSGWEPAERPPRGARASRRTVRAMQLITAAAAVIFVLCAVNLPRTSGPRRPVHRAPFDAPAESGRTGLEDQVSRLVDAVGELSAQQQRLVEVSQNERSDPQRDGDAASRWQSKDWMPPRRRSELFREFHHHPPTPEWSLQERRQTCNDDEADRAVQLGVSVIVRHVSGAFVHPAADPAQAVQYFERAVELKPSCACARLNLAIVLVTGPPPGLAVGADGGSFQHPADVWRVPADDDGETNPAVFSLPAVKRALDMLEESYFADGPLLAKALLWRGFVLELLGDTRASCNLYYRTYTTDVSVARRYFGRGVQDFTKKHPRYFFRDYESAQGPVGRYGQHVYGAVLRRLLLYAEFGEHFSGHDRVTRSEAVEFVDTWRIFVRDLFPAYVLRAVQFGYRLLISARQLLFQDDQGQRYFKHNDPVQHYLSAVYNELVSRLTDYATKPTYAYMGAYIGGADLRPHLDRNQCEWTMTVAADVNPADEVCPLWYSSEPIRIHAENFRIDQSALQKPSMEKRGVVFPKPGDALLFRGRALLHWRDEIPVYMNCTNVFLHYVLEDYDTEPLA